MTAINRAPKITFPLKPTYKNQNNDGKKYPPEAISWGDTVNVASRMESMGIPGRIQVTERVVQVTSDDFEFEDRGILEVKGRGKMRTYLLEDNMGFQKVNKNREHFIETYYH